MKEDVKILHIKKFYPLSLKKKHEEMSWSYLCRKHFKQELKRLNGKLPHCSVD